MTKKDVIDGWKSISTYIGKSAKTIQRWERESGFPIHRVPGRRSVFALKDEVDAWLSEQTKQENSAWNEQPPKDWGVDWLFSPRHVPLVVLLFVALALGALAVRDAGYSSKPKHALGPLTAKIVPHSEGSVLTVRNAVGGQALRMKFDHNWCEFALRTPGTRMWLISDVNNDGLDDFIFVNPEKTIPEIDLLLQHKDGSLKLERTLSVKETIHYQETTFEMRRVQYFDLMDLDGDHAPALLLTTQNSYLYPALLVVITLQGKRLLVMAHPGWFRNMQVQYVNGIPVVYVSGTNNFIAQYSEPIVIRISMDWHRRGVCFSLLRPDRKMAGTVPEGVSVTYARLGDFPEMRGASPWEPAVIRPQRWGADGRHVMLDVGYYDSRTGKAALPGPGPVQEIRQFDLNEDLSLIRADYNDVVKNALDIHSDQEPFRFLLNPRYWNGRDWQDSVCTVPQE